MAPGLLTENTLSLPAFAMGDRISGPYARRVALFHRVNHEPVQLTSGPMGFVAAAPSLDGKKIFAVGAQLRGELVRYDSKAGQFVPYLSGISASGVSFSPDGQWVAYSAFPEGTIWRSRADGSDKLQLTYAPLWGIAPSWSPDGKQIVFSGAAPPNNLGLYLVSAEGGAPEALLTNESQLFRPAWSADGKAILFQESANEESSIKSLELASRRISTLPGSEKPDDSCCFSRRALPGCHHLRPAEANALRFQHPEMDGCKRGSGCSKLVVRWQVSLL